MSLDQATAPATNVGAPGVEAVKELPPTKEGAPLVDKPEEDPKFAARFAALSRREKQILERERKIKADEAAYVAYKSSVDSAKNDPLGYLQAAGLSYEEVTNYLIGKVDATKPLTVEDKIAALEEKLTRKEQEAVEAAQRKEEADLQAAVDQYKTNIIEYIGSNTDKYELIQANEAQDLVFETALAHWENTGGNQGGEVLSYDRACDAVESWLEIQVREKILKTKKFGKSEPSAQEDLAPGTKQTAHAPTLTNRNTVSASPATAKSQLLDRDESLRRAAAMLRYHK